MDTALGQSESVEPRRRVGWTLPGLVVGLGVIATCLLVPQIEENRALLYDVHRLQAEQTRVEEQIRVNEQFFAKVSVDPTLISRLAQRQLRLTPGGTESLEVQGLTATDVRSPFQLTTVAPVAAMAPYKPFGGELLAAFRDRRTRLYMMGAALFVIGMCLILDGPKKSSGQKTSATEGDSETPVANEVPEAAVSAESVKLDEARDPGVVAPMAGAA